MRVLIAEDDPVCWRLLEALLVKWGYEVLIARDGDEAWAELQREDRPALAILDWMMPGIDGVHLCRTLREQRRSPYIYLILLSARNQKEDLIQGMGAGADDYLMKPFDARELELRLRAGRRILDLQRDLMRTQEALQHQATHDSLTGLWNHSAILDFLQREVARAERHSTPLSLVIADLDHFKQINDTFGHLVGDNVLSEAARSMRQSIRPSDMVGRYGGEEFFIVLPECDATMALQIAGRVRQSVPREQSSLTGTRITVTLSLGVAEYLTLAGGSGLTRVDASALIRAADSALYRAKGNGRNRVELATTEQPHQHSRAKETPCGF